MRNGKYETTVIGQHARPHDRSCYTVYRALCMDSAAV